MHDAKKTGYPTGQPVFLFLKSEANKYHKSFDYILTTRTMHFYVKLCLILHAEKHEKTAQPCRFWLDYAVYVFGGDMGIRTPDLLHAKQPLSQLSYTPVFILFWHIGKVMVEATGLEPAASWSQTKHSTKLSYASPMSSPCAAKPPF